MSDYFTEKFIKDVLKAHPAECVFELDAPAKILARLNERGLNDFSILNKCNNDKLDAWRQCWHESEIYCPHEGINRLSECGVNSLDWELA